ncbi:MAG TPA: hybrid sensor histidine kinase/response regulator [Gammaproteobacteria bacterium]|nr:hybrid sensor histidine kinase/response regulator [Gammaproteobacteria bacterium]
MSAPDLSDLSMMELFRLDAETQLQALDAGLLALERDNASAVHLEACMRAAHSLKGAARIVGLTAGTDIAHAMEDCFVAAQRSAIAIGREQIDVMLQGADLLKRIAQTAEAQIAEWSGARRMEVDVLLGALRAVREGASDSGSQSPAGEEGPSDPAIEAPAAMPPDSGDGEARVLRVTAEHLDRLLGLAGESMVESRWFKPFAESLFRMKRLQNSAAASLDVLRESLGDDVLGERGKTVLAEAQQRIDECHGLLAQQLVEFDMFDSRSTKLAHGLYNSALACRMRPFEDGVRALPRMVRDVGRALGKEVRLEIVGGTTPVDRDILEKLDAPLGHLLRNAVDHGIESPDLRVAVGKPREGVVRLEARHSAGRLQITATDDGRGVNVPKLREAIVERKLTNRETAQRLSEPELLEFLFLPGFTLKPEVTEISGRGVGLDVVHNMIKQVRGTIRVSSEAGRGTRFQMQLPLTLSVVRTLLVEICAEPYAFPLTHIVRTLKVRADDIELLEGRQHFRVDGRSVGLVSAQQLFGGETPEVSGGELPVIILGDPANAYGLVVDRFLGERDLVVQPLDSRLGKIKDIAAGSLMEDGSPVLIVDVDDMLRSVEKVVAGGRLQIVRRDAAHAVRASRRRVLVVDDSLTVRELERKLLDQAGYEVEIAVDGVDGWNAARAGEFDLIITDVDMPRMDGIELVKLIKKDERLGRLPVMIVSYKDREEDRERGLEAGADYYLTKGSFYDDTLQQAVASLIGSASS